MNKKQISKTVYTKPEIEVMHLLIENHLLDASYPVTQATTIKEITNQDLRKKIAKQRWETSITMKAMNQKHFKKF